MVCIVVVGSINMDLVIVVVCFLVFGEILFGECFFIVFGGKGVNQVVVVVRLGVEVMLVGVVGDDVFGVSLKQGLVDEGVDFIYVVILFDVGSGIVLIIVVEGDNQIIVVFVVNVCVILVQVYVVQCVIECVNVVLVQMEILLELVEVMVCLGYCLGVLVIFNFVLVQLLLCDWFVLVSYFMLNQYELVIVLGVDVDDDFCVLMWCVLCLVVFICGGEGVWYCEDGDLQYQVGFVVFVVDIIGVGDIFNGVLVVYLCEGLQQVVCKVCVVVVLLVIWLGVQGGMFYVVEVDVLFV